MATVAARSVMGSYKVCPCPADLDDDDNGTLKDVSSTAAQTSGVAAEGISSSGCSSSSSGQQAQATSTSTSRVPFGFLFSSSTMSSSGAAVGTTPDGHVAATGETSREDDVEQSAENGQPPEESPRHASATPAQRPSLLSFLFPGSGTNSVSGAAAVSPRLPDPSGDSTPKDGDGMPALDSAATSAETSRGQTVYSFRSGTEGEELDVETELLRRSDLEHQRPAVAQGLSQQQEAMAVLSMQYVEGEVERDQGLEEEGRGDADAAADGAAADGSSAAAAADASVAAEDSAAAVVSCAGGSDAVTKVNPEVAAATTVTDAASVGAPAVVAAAELPVSLTCGDSTAEAVEDGVATANVAAASVGDAAVAATAAAAAAAAAATTFATEGPALQDTPASAATADNSAATPEEATALAHSVAAATAAAAAVSSAAALVEAGVQDAEEDACSVCLEVFTESDPAILTVCNHEFHFQCIIEWAQRKEECPMCWQALRLQDPDSQELLEACARERAIAAAAAAAVSAAASSGGVIFMGGGRRGRYGEPHRQRWHAVSSSSSMSLVGSPPDHGPGATPLYVASLFSRGNGGGGEGDSPGRGSRRHHNHHHHLHDRHHHHHQSSSPLSGRSGREDGSSPGAGQEDRGLFGSPGKARLHSWFSHRSGHRSHENTPPSSADPSPATSSSAIPLTGGSGGSSDVVDGDVSAQGREVAAAVAGFGATAAPANVDYHHDTMPHRSHSHGFGNSRLGAGSSSTNRSGGSGSSDCISISVSSSSSGDGTGCNVSTRERGAASSGGDAEANASHGQSRGDKWRSKISQLLPRRGRSNSNATNAR